MSNIWIGDGRLTKDPEMRYAQSGKAVTAIRLAVDRSGSDNVADFFDVVAFGNLAEVTAKYLSKGRHVLVEGSLRHQTWTDAESGDRRGRVEIVANRVTFLGGPRQEVEPDEAA
jgi:single-strand DNA-binding protein